MSKKEGSTSKISGRSSITRLIFPGHRAHSNRDPIVAIREFCIVVFSLAHARSEIT